MTWVIIWPDFDVKYLLQEEIEFTLENDISFAVGCCVRDYHIFKSLREPPVGTMLIANDEADPQSFMCDKFAIVSVNSGLDTVGHIPKFMSKLTYLLLKCGRHIKCEIAGVKKSSKDLEQG